MENTNHLNTQSPNYDNNVIENSFEEELIDYLGKIDSNSKRNSKDYSSTKEHKESDNTKPYNSKYDENHEHNKQQSKHNDNHANLDFNLDSLLNSKLRIKKKRIKESRFIKGLRAEEDDDLNSNLEDIKSNKSDIILSNKEIPITSVMKLGQINQDIKKQYKSNEDVQKVDPCEINFPEILNLEILLNRDASVKGFITEETHKEVRGSYLSIVRTQSGSRILQKLLQNTQNGFISEIFSELSDKLFELMTDSYANYFCQKFFASLKEENKLKFISSIGPYITIISKSKIGTFSLQGMIDHMELVSVRTHFINFFKKLPVQDLKIICQVRYY